MEIVLIVVTILGILAAAYPIGHTFEHLEGNSPPPHLQQRNEENEGISMIILIGCVILGISIVFVLMG